MLTFAAFASFTYTSIWLQSVLGLSPIKAGLTGLPLSVAAFVVSAAIGRFLHGTRPGPIIGGGLLLIGVGGLVGAVLVHGVGQLAGADPRLRDRRYRRRAGHADAQLGRDGARCRCSAAAWRPAR